LTAATGFGAGRGVPVAIDSNAHSTLHFDNLCFGVAQARCGWLGTRDVPNIRTLKELKPLLGRSM
jgi:DNA polymerase (family X)